MKAFEIHTFQGGRWKIDSVFDDRDLAMFEAQRMDESHRYAGIRVIEENFDEERNTSTAKTIFRGKKTEFKAEAAQKKSASTAQKGGTAAPKGGASGQRRPAAKSRGKVKKKASVAGRLILMLLMLMFGVAVLIGLRILTGGS